MHVLPVHPDLQSIERSVGRSTSEDHLPDSGEERQESDDGEPDRSRSNCQPPPQGGDRARAVLVLCLFYCSSFQHLNGQAIFVPTRRSQG